MGLPIPWHSGIDIHRQIGNHGLNGDVIYKITQRAPAIIPAIMQF